MEKMEERITDIKEKDHAAGSEVWKSIPFADRFMLSAYHTMGGCAAMLAWNMVLNLSLSMQTTLWPNVMLSDIMLGCFQSGSISTVLVLIYLDTMTLNRKVARAVHLVVVAGLGLLLIPVYYFSGVEHSAQAKALLGITCFLTGVGNGIYQPQAFAFAAIVPRRTDQSILISAGNGIAGLVSWGAFSLLYEFMFDKDSVRQQKTLHLCMVIISITFLCITYCLMEYCFRIPIFRQKLRETNELEKKEQEALVKGDELRDPELATPAADGPDFWATVRRAAYPAFRVGFVLFATILVFPASGPFSWPLSRTMKNVNMGVFQLGDLVFRFMPALGSWTLLSVHMTEAMVFGRVVFLWVCFIIPVYLTNFGFMSSAPWLFFCMIIMVLTNGWGMTCSIVHCMGTAKNKKDAETTANIMTLAIVSGAMLGAFGSKLPLLFT